MGAISLDLLELVKGYPMFLKMENITDPTSPTGAVYTDLSGRTFTFWVLEHPGDDNADAVATVNQASSGVTVTAGTIRMRLITAAESAALKKGRTYTVRGEMDDANGDKHPFNFGTDDAMKFTAHFNVI